MRRSHLDALEPVCPACRAPGSAAGLELAALLAEEDGHVVQGILRCSRPGCQREHPIVDGIPIVLADLRGFVSANLLHVLARDDLHPELESLVGDCCGPGSALDVTRTQLSSYGADHHGDLLPGAAPGIERPSVLAVLHRLLELAGGSPAGPTVDVGCSVGRTTFELAAATGGLALGVDLNFAMLRVASRVLRTGRLRFPLRRVGLVHDAVDVEVRLEGSERVDFWCCDAAALPFADGTFGSAALLNLIDCVPSPRDVLAEAARCLRPGGRALACCPYDWSAGATPVETWLGGHSQRGPERGASEPVLRALLGSDHPAALPDLRLVAEDRDVPWRVRMHDRSTVEYRVDAVVAERAGAQANAGK